MSYQELRGSQSPSRRRVTFGGPAYDSRGGRNESPKLRRGTSPAAFRGYQTLQPSTASLRKTEVAGYNGDFDGTFTSSNRYLTVGQALHQEARGNNSAYASMGRSRIATNTGLSRSNTVSGSLKYYPGDRGDTQVSNNRTSNALRLTAYNAQGYNASPQRDQRQSMKRTYSTQSRSPIRNTVVDKTEGDYRRRYSQLLEAQNLDPNPLLGTPTSAPTGASNTPFQDFSTFGTNRNLVNRRYFIIGDFETGKSCLWLRYLFYDQKHAKVSACKETPKKDGYVFTKKLFDGQSEYRIDFWDFLTPLEARQCLGMKVQDADNAMYDAIGINQDYIKNAELAVIVYDVSKPHTLESAKGNAVRMSGYGVKNIIMVGNKSDKENQIDEADFQEWLDEHEVRNFYVCATNNVGTEDLFITMDNISTGGGSLMQLNCLQGIRSEYARSLLAEEQEICCMQLAWISFRGEMKFYENKELKDSFWVRSDRDDRLARDIESTVQVDEILEKMPYVRSMLEHQIDVAQNLNVTHTEEYQEANKKLMEMNIIKERLVETKERNMKINRWLGLLALLSALLALTALSVGLYFYFKPPDLTYEIREKEAEAKMLSYQNSRLLTAESQILTWLKMLNSYKTQKENNLKSLQKEKNYPRDKIGAQEIMISNVIHNKITIFKSSLYWQPNISRSLLFMKNTDHQAVIYKLAPKDGLISKKMFYNTEIEYQGFLQSVDTQAAQLGETTQFIKNAYTAYINTGGTNETYIDDYHKRFNELLNSYENLDKLDDRQVNRLINSLGLITDSIEDSSAFINKTLNFLPNRTEDLQHKQDRCLMACRNLKTSVCLNKTLIDYASKDQLKQIKEAPGPYRIPWRRTRPSNNLIQTREMEQVSLAGVAVVNGGTSKVVSGGGKVVVNQPNVVNNGPQNNIHKARAGVVGTRADVGDATLQIEKRLIQSYTDAKELKSQTYFKLQHINDGAMDYNNLKPDEYTQEEIRIFGNFTNTACEEASEAYWRWMTLKKYFYIFIALLILSILLAIMMCCFGGYRKWRMRVRDNFFGHNNGEDRLIIDHHWQQEEPCPVYVSVRDPQLQSADLRRPFVQ